ncbi:MAG: metal ABC transporter substrate-binding protein [Verrucomicrobiia bacterium]
MPESVKYNFLNNSKTVSRSLCLYLFNPTFKTNINPVKRAALFFYIIILTNLLLTISTIPCYAGQFSEKKTVVTSIYPLFLISTNLSKGIDSYVVENLIPTGSNPHEYQFKPEDIKRIQKADLIILTGLAIDEWLIDASKKLFPEKIKHCKTILKSLDGKLIPVDSGRPDDLKKFNPHFWLDPMMVANVASNVAAYLAEFQPKEKEAIYKNLEIFINRLTELDLKISEQLSRVKDRPIIVKHNAYDYFARRYNIKIAGVVEQSHDMPVTPQYLSKLIKTGRENKVAAVFGETGSSNEIEKRVAEELNAPFAVLDPIETGDLNLDAYAEKMLKNAEILVNTVK